MLQSSTSIYKSFKNSDSQKLKLKLLKSDYSLKRIVEINYNHHFQNFDFVLLNTRF